MRATVKAEQTLASQRSVPMGSKVIASTWLVVGLVLSSQVAAQDVAAPSPKLTGMPALSIAGAGTAVTWGANPVQANDWKSSAPIPDSSDRFTAPSNIHLNLMPVSNTSAIHRLPFYLTAPYWLPRSRPFKASNDPNSEQPAPLGALINDVATLVRSTSSN
jgi:hypothetical protein